MRFAWKFLVSALCILLLPFVSGGYNGCCYAQGDLYKAVTVASGLYKLGKAYNLSDDDLAAYMADVMKQMDAQNQVASSSNQYSQRLTRITSKLKSISGIPLNFKVYLTQEANAFASPDGSVRVYSKLMDIMSDEELLGVIGHEIGHIACRHSRKRLKASLIASAVRDGLMLSDGNIGVLAASCVGGLSELLVNAKYSREQESEADRYGYTYLKKKGYNPYAMALALTRLQELQKTQNGGKSSFNITLLSTHPDLDSRISVLTKKAKKDGFLRQ